MEPCCYGCGQEVNWYGLLMAIDIPFQMPIREQRLESESLYLRLESNAYPLYLTQERIEIEGFCRANPF